MAERPPAFFSSTSTHKRSHARGWRIAAFWSIVGIIAVAALVSVSVASSVRRATWTTPGMNLAPPQPVSFIPFTGEPDFNERFVPEKRSAREEVLPAQF